MGFNRRDFLKASATAAAGIAFPSIVKAASPWAVLPASAGDMPKYKILEIFLPGGASQWENFWVSHDGPPSEYGNTVYGGDLNWRGLEGSVYELQWQSCGNSPSSSLHTAPFGTDINGTNISWGPATSPLWRPDIYNRCRMLVTSHGDRLHFGATYRTMTGRRFGSPRGAGLGAAIQRHHQSLGQQQDIPYSYVFAPDYLNPKKEYFFQYPTLIGQHPGPARPLGIKVGKGADAKLQRDGISVKADRLFNELRDQYRDLLRWQGTGVPISSADFESFDSASDYLIASEQLNMHFGGTQLEANDESICAFHPMHSPSGFGLTQNRTRRSLELAAYMLNNGAKHITVLDGGFNNGSLMDSNTPYDAHGNGGVNLVEMTSVHLFNLCQSLASVIDDGTTASSNVGKINLNDTLIIVHTEFNREPALNGANCREHYPNSNVALLIGGTVYTRAIFGGIALDSVNEYETAQAVNALTPTDVHAATLYAAGVNPIDPDNFTTGDEFSSAVNPGGGASTDEILTNLEEKVLGVTNYAAISTV